MADDLSSDDLIALSANPFAFADRSFEILRGAADLLAADDASARQIIIQCHEHRSVLTPSMRAVSDALVRELGLFPYLADAALGDRSTLVRETLRLNNLGDGQLVLHAAQAEVYARLIAGDNVVLSAPTSFGKSLVIDALLASGKFDNVLIVVPTLALIDEIRRRLATRRTGHKVVTHPTQPQGARNAFVLTAERVLEIDDLPTVDLFVLDEFYKLNDGDSRAEILNQVFYEMRKAGIQYYLLGPNVARLKNDVPAALQHEFMRRDETTVALRFHELNVPKAERARRLASLAAELERMVLVYCQSPDSAHRTARMLLDADFAPPVPELDSAADWVADHFHPDWAVVEALRHGIGIHHGQLPRALGQFMVKAFEDGRIRWLIATGTLIEGVNTHARHVVVFDVRKPGNYTMDEFSFRNICGRCGRMFRHFSGDVWLFGKRPKSALPEVDIPILSQPDEAPPSLLQHLDEHDRSERTRERLEPFDGQSDLSKDTLRRNVGLDLNAQIKVARLLRASPYDYHRALGFTQTPTWDQLQVVCGLIWEFGGLSSNYTRSSKQLARHLMTFSMKGSVRALIAEDLGSKTGRDLDVFIKDVCGFVRTHAGFAVPVRLHALDRIQREVFRELGIRPGNYESYAARLEGLFLEAPLVALDEYGVPPELAHKLRATLRPDGNLDSVLERLRTIDPDAWGLSDFETELVRYAQRGL